MTATIRAGYRDEGASKGIKDLGGSAEQTATKMDRLRESANKAGDAISRKTKSVLGLHQQITSGIGKVTAIGGAIAGVAAAADKFLPLLEEMRGGVRALPEEGQRTLEYFQRWNELLGTNIELLSKHAAATKAIFDQEKADAEELANRFKAMQDDDKKRLDVQREFQRLQGQVDQEALTEQIRARVAQERSLGAVAWEINDLEQRRLDIIAKGNALSGSGAEMEKERQKLLDELNRTQITLNALRERGKKILEEEKEEEKERQAFRDAEAEAKEEEHQRELQRIKEEEEAAEKAHQEELKRLQKEADIRDENKRRIIDGIRDAAKASQQAAGGGTSPSTVGGAAAFGGDIGAAPQGQPYNPFAFGFDPLGTVRHQLRNPLEIGRRPSAEQFAAGLDFEDPAQGADALAKMAQENIKGSQIAKLVRQGGGSGGEAKKARQAFERGDFSQIDPAIMEQAMEASLEQLAKRGDLDQNVMELAKESAKAHGDAVQEIDRMNAEIDQIKELMGANMKAMSRRSQRANARPF